MSNEVVGRGSQPFRRVEEVVGRGPERAAFLFGLFGEQSLQQGTVPTTGNSPYNGGQPTSQACNSGCRERFLTVPQGRRVTTPSVIPAHNLKVTSAGIQENEKALDSRLRGNDEIKEGQRPFIDGHGEPAEPCALRPLDELGTGLAQGDKEGVMVSSSNHAPFPSSSSGQAKLTVTKLECHGEPFDKLRTGSVEPCTKFMSVRFGNVLGSRGSVLPLFLDQLKHGGPLTVTDPEMKRYFMTIPEAVSLVLQASTLGQGGEVFVLDMGEPVMIVNIAEELIRLHGMEPYRDIDIQFTGLRPGEKLFEEILTSEEGTDASCHEKIFVARNSGKYTLDELSDILDEFSAAVRDPSADSDEKMKQLLRKYVKYYENK